MPSRARPAQAIHSTAEFARYVGLSRSTISRALNGHGDLKQKTLDRINAALEATGFTPNAHAVNLRGQSSNMVGVCMENFLNPTAVSKVSFLQQRLRDHGITALIEVMEPGTSRKTLQHFRSLRVGAVVFIGHFDPNELAVRLVELAHHDTPHLVIDAVGVERANTISLDREEAMYQVTNRLFELGHRRFGLLGISGAFQTVNDRMNGILRAMGKHHLDPARSLVSLDHLHARHNHFDYGAILARSFLQLEHLPTAYIAVNDETAFGAFLEFQAAGLKAPADFSLFGFNNQNICQMMRPQLSSVDQQIERTVEVAVDCLLRLITKQPRRRLTRLIEPALVERGSIGPAPAAVHS